MNLENLQFFIEMQDVKFYFFFNKKGNEIYILNEIGVSLFI